MMNNDKDAMIENNDLKSLARPYAKFILQGEPVDPDLITETLGVLPARRFKKGDAYGKKGNKGKALNVKAANFDDFSTGRGVSAR